MKNALGRRSTALIAALLLIGLTLWWRRAVTDVPGVTEVVVPHAGVAASALPAGKVDSARVSSAVGVVTVGSAASSSPQALFAYVRPAESAALDQALPAPTREIHYVRLNRALIDGKASPFWQQPGRGTLELPLPGGAVLRVVIAATTALGADRFTSTGVIKGRPQSRALFSYNAGFLHASVEDVELGSYTLRTATEQLSQFFEVDESLVLGCATPEKPAITAEILHREKARQAAAAAIGDAAGRVDPLPEATTAASAGAGVEIHVMIVYTQAVLPTLSGAARVAALQSAFDQAIATANSDFERSLVSARLKLVKVAETNYAGDELSSSSSGWQDAMLTAVAKTDDGRMDEIHAIRDAAGADLVCLIQNRPNPSTSGIAYVFEKPSDNTNPLWGFSVVAYSTLLADHVFSHELAHCLGCGHARGDTGANGTKDGAYTYSYGYRFTGRDGLIYRDIMAYAPGARLPYFSNPAVTAPAPVNVPLGVPIGQPGREANNALTIDQSAFEVAAFRLQTQTATNTGTLINVATRAFSGAGEQQLIGGFVIQGTSPKKMLLRAAGPAIAAAPFGVPDTLADPRLTLYNTDRAPATKVGENDNWSTPVGTGAATGAEIAGAAAAVGAFPFPAASRDAAFLATLAPGSYTVNVESATGATGTALVEAYEVDRTGNKIVNLATRGYADVGKPMIGGFVVQAGAGPTKRILIRVQGPSLAQYGLTAMDDPFLEIYNSAGDLVMKNDDWSTGAASVNGLRDDFRPTVTYYSEQQIFATGFAPGNRREPCVMADLAPGSYTAVVRPFESLPTQPAKPGVAIVEVYEVNPR